MRKFVSIALAAAMVLSMSACGGSSSKETTAAETQAKETQAESKTDESKAEESESSGEAKEGVMPAVAKEDIKVGVIHIGDPAAGSGYTYAHDQGIVGMQKNLGLEDSQIVRKNNVDDTDATAIETAITECIEEGCNIIFATSWGYMDTCEALAEEYPEVIFSHGTGYKSNGTNFNNYFGRIYQARYLTGIAAGMKTKSNKIGYVAAMGKDNSEVTGGCNAFAMGVASVNPDAKVYVKVTNSWLDPEGEGQAAEALIAEGCDVIGQHCDTPNPQLAAEKAGIWGVGYNSDMSQDAPAAVLTSTMWDWSVYYTEAVKSLIDGTWTGENYFGSIADGLVTFAPLSDLCEEGTAEKVEEAKAKMVSGEWDVFDGVIECNDGSTVGEEGKSLSDADITGNMNWYYKNVVEK
ncbi:BMP family ABC transporter substrate-binding protein [Clostridium sp. AM58-1XD]|uniref:BMP family ABC transporter substrate-binding protein n=1 Tax=Clostridium sp. AM58-1XD TaxID=2292307 RepID=UPI000E482352|nr:BMP family ABC transporter substrate-binding protein [Clostridium sp. AM58-1XD]RGY99108.1 BMP family ABC transporter substrate-binding protein [Clostridium sp. AM58-1XD]